MSQLKAVSLTWDKMKPLLFQADIIGVDTETNAEDIRDGRGYAIGMSLAVCLDDIYFMCYLPCRHPEGNLDFEVWEDIRDTFNALQGSMFKTPITTFNTKFDLVSLKTLGIDWEGEFYCTLNMCHLINENFPMKKDLNNCCKKYIGDESKKKSQDFDAYCKFYGWGKVPVHLMKPYAEWDAVLHLALYYAIKPLFDENVPAAYWEHKQDFTRVVNAMERRGVKVDVELCNKLARIGDEVLGDLTETIGGNLASSTFLKEIFLDRLKLPIVKTTPTGRPCFDKFAMEEYDLILERLDSPLANYVREYRGWQKSVSSNYRPYVELLSPDGRLRPNYKLHGTRTGRMSCEKPNLQQIPKTTEKPWNGDMKHCFIPEEGYLLYEVDYSQLELRLATAYADEKTLKQVFIDGRDIFDEMKGPLGLTRFWTKQFVYSVQYGAGNKRISNVFGFSLEEAQSLRNTYKEAYPGFAVQTQRASNLCKSTGKIKLWTGRYRHFISKTEDAHKAFNSVIQGGAADIVEKAMVQLFKNVDNENECRMLLQVHDSVVLEIKADKVDYYRPLILETMIDSIPKEFGVKFAADFHEWGEAA